MNLNQRIQDLQTRAAKEDKQLYLIVVPLETFQTLTESMGARVCLRDFHFDNGACRTSLIWPGRLGEIFIVADSSATKDNWRTKTINVCPLPETL